MLCYPFMQAVENVWPQTAGHMITVFLRRKEEVSPSTAFYTFFCFFGEGGGRTYLYKLQQNFRVNQIKAILKVNNGIQKLDTKKHQAIMKVTNWECIQNDALEIHISIASLSSAATTFISRFLRLTAELPFPHIFFVTTV